MYGQTLRRGALRSACAAALLTLVAGGAAHAGLGYAAADSDHDGVPNIRDNCPQRPNLEQFDSDHDGIGDECDLTLKLTGTQAPGQLQVTLPSFTTHQTIDLGQLVNNGAEPVQWRLRSQSDDFDPLPRGSLAPGQSVPLQISVDATRLPHALPVHEQVRVDYASASVTVQIDITVEDEPAQTYCEYDVMLQKVEVTEDQNSAGDGCCGGNKLEIEVIDQIGTATADWPSNGSWVDMKEGDVNYPNAIFLTDSVPAGSTVTLPVYNKVIEHDSGANGADDWGDASGELEFICSGTGYTDLLKTVSLTHNGNGNGKIKVTTRASWSE